jgi:hypothetical protein
VTLTIRALSLEQSSRVQGGDGQGEVVVPQMQVGVMLSVFNHHECKPKTASPEGEAAAVSEKGCVEDGK